MIDRDWTGGVHGGLRVNLGDRWGWGGWRQGRFVGRGSHDGKGEENLGKE